MTDDSDSSNAGMEAAAFMYGVSEGAEKPVVSDPSAPAQPREFPDHAGRWEPLIVTLVGVAVVLAILLVAGALGRN
jgi:hypothetical protein